MTIVAYRSGVLAFDEQVTAGDSTRIGTVLKGRVIGEYLVACSGTLHVCQSFMAWLEQHFSRGGGLCAPPQDMREIDADADMVGIAIDRKGRFFRFDGLVYPYELSGEYHAIGSGRDFALGAMEAGADAVKAVEVAIKLDIGCGGAVRVLTLDDIPIPEKPDNVVMLKERRKVKRGK